MKGSECEEGRSEEKGSKGGGCGGGGDETSSSLALHPSGREK
jgi:hypothetical protein